MASRGSSSFCATSMLSIFPASPAARARGESGLGDAEDWWIRFFMFCWRQLLTGYLSPRLRSLETSMIDRITR